MVRRRTYSRPLDNEGRRFETWEQTVDRVIGHQRWLWTRAKGTESLEPHEERELDELRELLLDRKASLSGRTLWLGGTETAKRREASQFNCSYSRLATVHDAVDHFWLLLQGCGVGAMGSPGILNGFAKTVDKITVIRSQRTMQDWENGRRGAEANCELFRERPGGTRCWHLIVGDSGEAWAKSFGKLLAMKQPVDEIVLDFSQVRPAGIRLRGYGWISSGDAQIAYAYENIVKLLSRKAGKLLNRIDLLDIENWIGQTLSSRRSAEIHLCPYGDPEWEAFAFAKKDHFSTGNPQRGASNNSLLFYSRPTKAELLGIFSIMQMAGGSEPGFINVEEARRRAPWFAGVNPCAEILLGDYSFCNLVEVDVSKFNKQFYQLSRAVYIMARANYRQTCVNLKDGILQDTWDELNRFLRLCGVGLTGLIQWDHFNHFALETLRQNAHHGANSMADELGLPRAQAVTTIKPSGTLAVHMDTTSGVHRPPGRYLIHTIQFSENDPLVKKLEAAGYHVRPNPYDATGRLVELPVEYQGV